MDTKISLGYSQSIGNTSTVDFDPGLSLQYKYYYNSAKRAAKNKRTEMNSLNYIGPVAGIIFYDEQTMYSLYDTQKNHRTLNSVGFVWGLQRNYRSRFSLDLNCGLGYAFGKSTIPVEYATRLVTKNFGEVRILGQINLGFWINKRK